ncbi:siroheme decarboxylase subunit beta [Colwellia psychrerythraea]|uniref:Siroheme decarboxylase NirL subunit n=1 Tax=Colwellia psychrerythraea TaxID=28229 RepID=A0A099KXQ1_COLPS|nr:Lrp/AsnC family transcriptional regulator [Colwellia psychrerythraea]KGJ95494.1 putative transcriptional regulator, AsnC family [Colwellia psychrerythraea]
MTKSMTKDTAIISQLQQDIINNSQKGFPLTSKPYKTIAEQLAQVNIVASEQEVFDAIDDLNKQEVLSRVGPVFDHKKAGASTLAALAVPEKDLDKVAGIVNQFDQVNHNYGREHSYNLWFVVTASDMVALKSTIVNIELLTGLPVLVLPMEASYHIDLAFSINVTGVESPFHSQENKQLKQSSKISGSNDDVINLNNYEKAALRGAIEKGLPTALSPYQVIAKQLALTEQQVMMQIANWQEDGLIRRFGLVIKHRKLGYDANAMVVWNIPNDDMDKVAQKLAKCAPVSLCYQRPRRLPDWPYNLFCMIHGTDRNLVLQQIRQITEQLGLESIEKDVLFSFKAYKQHGARYSKAKISKINASKKDNSNEIKKQGQAHG